MGDMWGHKCNAHEKNAFMDKSTQVPRLYLGDLNQPLNSTQAALALPKEAEYQREEMELKALVISVIGSVQDCETVTTCCSAPEESSSCNRKCLSVECSR